MLPAGFEPTIPADERAQPYALDRAANGTGLLVYYKYKTLLFCVVGGRNYGMVILETKFRSFCKYKI